MGLINFIKENFSHVFPIILCAIFALSLIIERFKALYNVYVIKDAKEFIKKIHQVIVSNQIHEAIKICDEQKNKPLAFVIKSILLRADMPDDAIESAAQMACSESIRTLQSRTSFLATIANIVTLLGLLGTIIGLIQSFEAVGHADPAQKSALLSAGIATAMNATMMGLGVAIPCMLSYSFFMNKTQKLIAELEDGVSFTLDALKLRYFINDDEEINQDNSENLKLMKKIS
jgi:biopolymer transport protein ExbB/TolQ